MDTTKKVNYYVLTTIDSEKHKKMKFSKTKNYEKNS